MNNLGNETAFLTQRIKELETMVLELKREQDEGEALNFSWVGNLGRWYWNCKTNEINFNPLKITTLGYSPDEIPKKIGYQFFTDKLHPEDYERVMQNMREHLQGLRPVYEVEYRIQAKDGSWKWYYDRGKVTRRDEQNQPVFLSGIVFDISAQKEIETRLLSMLNLKDRIISILSHDLRAPLGSMNQFLAFMIENFQQNKPEKNLEHLKVVLNQSETIYQAFDSILSWAQINQPELVGVKKPVHLNPILDKILELLKNLAQKKQITIQNQIQTPVYVIGDENMLATIFRNLVANALKFTAEQGQVTLFGEINKVENTIEIAVRDTGIGIPLEKQALLFSSAGHYKRLGTNHEKGIGLGLIVCKEFVEKNNGGIRLVSEEGKGTTFYVRLSLCSDKEQE